MTSSLLKLLSEEGLVHSEFLRSQKQAKLRDESIKLPIYICHDQKNLDSFKHKTDRASYRKGSSVFSSKQASPDLVRKSKPLSSTEDEPAIDEVAVRTVISILSGYIGRYIKDSSFQKMIRNKCNSCLVRKRKDLDDAIFAKMELGMESIEKLVQEQGTRKELRIKSLRISIQLMSIVASLNSKKSRNGSTCGIPNSHISACAQLYLSIAYKLERNERISARHLLQVFSDSPFLARTHLLPDLWEHLFLPHLLHLKIWYNKELETLSNSQYLDKEKRMKALSKAYNEQIDMGTIQFALYYREWLKVGGKAPSTPAVPLPSRPSSAPSRRRSSDSYSSRSSMNRNLYRAVFGPTPEHLPLELNNQRRDSMDAWALKEGTLHCEEDGYDNYNYAITKMRTHRRSTSQDYRTSKNELWPDRQKSSDHFRFFSCQSVVSECLVKGNHIVRSNSINNVECRDLPLSDLSRAVTTICSSDSLTDCEIAIRVITKSWLDSHGNPVTENALSKASVIEGILEVLLASDDDEVLELAISILAEFVALNEANRLIILNSDPQLEIFMRLLKSSSLFLKAAVLLYLLRPKAKQMISIEWVALALRVLEFGDQLQTLFTIRCIPQKAALYFLDELLNGYSEDKNLENASEVVSLGGLSFLLRAFEIGDIDEKNNAAMLMSCCIQADGSCRNYLAENLNKNSLLELVALGIQKSNRSAFTLLTELLCLNRYEFAVSIFIIHSVIVEYAVEAIIEALDCHICNSKVQEKSAQALLMLGSHFSYTGEAAAKEWLLQQTGCHDKSVDLFCSNRIIDGNLNEEENAMEDWQRKVAIALLNTGGKRFLAALSNSIANGIQNLAQSCLYTVSWMNRILQSIKDETSQSGAHSVIGAELTESSNYERALYPSILPSKLQHLIKSSECLSILSKLDKELIDPLRNPS
ncbi:hypothetical protein RCOM_1424400 [Ricinus communis]|uniref:Ubiquitin-protein ligase n=1 Tax=Ricinus communis TaxID=3988 RepID=B9RRN7_RICCO|nr:hypothetical protein RCOM_1424400 [Ricinus communis]